jgi:hypothetical protein
MLEKFEKFAMTTLRFFVNVLINNFDQLQIDDDADEAKDIS